MKDREYFVKLTISHKEINRILSNMEKGIEMIRKSTCDLEDMDFLEITPAEVDNTLPGEDE